MRFYCVTFCGCLNGKKALIYAPCRGRKQSREYHIPRKRNNAVLSFHAIRNSGQEVFDLLPAFHSNPYDSNPVPVGCWYCFMSSYHCTCFFEPSAVQARARPGAPPGLLAGRSAKATRVQGANGPAVPTVSGRFCRAGFGIIAPVHRHVPVLRRSPRFQHKFHRTNPPASGWCG